MNSQEFCYWLAGFFELSDSNNLTEAQVKMIKEHLGLVFNKVTSSLDELNQESSSNKKKPIGEVTEGYCSNNSSRKCIKKDTETSTHRSRRSGNGISGIRIC